MSGAGDDLGFLLVELGVEDGVDEAFLLEDAGEHLAGMHAGGADEHGTALGVDVLDLLQHGVELFPLRLVDGIVGVLADVGLVGRDREDAELVDVEELLGLGFGRAGHAGQLVVEPEVVLDRDRGVGLGLAFDLDVFLGLDGLMQAVAPTAAGHEAAGVFIDDDDLVLLDDVVDVLQVEAVGLEELGNGMDRLGAFFEGRLQLGLLFDTSTGIEILAGIDLVIRADEIRQHERIGIAGVEEVAALLRQVRLVAFLVHRVEELFLLVVEIFLGLVGVAGKLRLVHQVEVRGIFEEPEESFGAGFAHLHPEQEHAGLFFEVRSILGRIGTVRGANLLQEIAGFAEEALAEFALGVDDRFDEGFELVVLVVDVDDRRSGDDQRRAGFIDQDRVHLVDDGEVVSALDLLLGPAGHAVVAEVVEAEFGVRPVGDVARIHRAPLLRALVVQNAPDGEPKELVDVAHPFRVAGGQVVIDGDDMDATAGQGVEVGGKGGDKSFAFASGHFGDVAPMKCGTADQLDVERDHFPLQFMATNDNGRTKQAAAGVFNDRKGLWKN